MCVGVCLYACMRASARICKSLPMNLIEISCVREYARGNVLLCFGVSICKSRDPNLHPHEQI